MRNVHLTPQLVQAVRDVVDIVDVAGDHTRLVRRGRRHQGLCPLHKEKTPSFSVDPAQGLFYCFGCGAGGDAIKLHMLATGDDFPAAVEALARRYGIPLPSPAEGRGASRAEGPDTQGALEAAQEFFAAALARTGEPRAYLERRRIPPELAERYGLGYAPDARHDLLGVLERRIPVAALVAAGLVGTPEGGGRPYDRFRHRLMFPIHSPSGRLAGFGGRTLGDDKAKYVNTSETEHFHKGRLLYGLHQAKREIRDGGRALLVEGYFDVLGAVASGVEWAVAGMGTALTPEQARLLSRYADEVVVGYDGDDAGETAFRRALPQLLGEGLGVRRARFGAGRDPDSLRLEAGPEAVARAVEEADDAVLSEIDRLLPAGVERDPHRQARAAGQVAELLAPIKDALVRDQYARRAAQRIGVTADLVLGRLRQERGGARARPPAAREEGTGAAERARPAAAYLPRELPYRTLEVQVLELLLAGEGEPLPPAEELPSDEVFFEPDCRNIYRVSRALYVRHGEPPSPKAVSAALGTDGDASGLMARILLESPSAPSNAGLPALLKELRRRWERQRLKELRREMDEAQRQGDDARLERLLREKTELGLGIPDPRHRAASGSA